VHQGFYSQYVQVRKKLFETADKYYKLGYRSFNVCGHSLGGALSELGSMALAHRFPDATVQMITFGAPSVGDTAFVNEFNKKIPLATRIVNNKDLVPCLPGANGIAGGFAKLGNLITKGKFSNPFKHNVNHLLQYSNGAWRSARWPSCSRCWSVHDHEVTEYADIVLHKPRNGHLDLSKYKAE